MNSVYTHILCLLLLLSFNQRTDAQNENLRFEHLGIEAGFSNNNVLAILQNSKGYLWFGTRDGLNKYYGYSEPNIIDNNL